MQSSPAMANAAVPAGILAVYSARYRLERYLADTVPDGILNGILIPDGI